MFNTHHSAVLTKKWKPASALSSKNQRGQYATTQWLEHSEQDDNGFEDDEALHHDDGDFSIERIEPLSHPLPKHVLAALTLLERNQLKQATQARLQQQIEEAKKGPVALDAKGDESENAHLPFVPQSYTVVGWDGKPLAKPQPVKKAQPVALPTPAPSIEEQPPEPVQAIEPEIVASEKVAPDESAAPEAAQEQVQEAPSEPTQALDENVETDDQAPHDLMASEQDDAQTEEHEASSPTESEEAEVQASAEDSELLEATATNELETQPETELAAAQDTEELHADQEASSQTDDAQSAELNESDLLNEEEVLVAQEELPQEELPPAEPQAEIAPGIPEEEVVLREQSHYLRGLEDGKKQIRQEMEQKVKDQCTVLASVSEQLNQLLQDPQRLYEPLKRLSLHVAEQLVLGELKQPTEVIERLVQRCLDEINPPVQGLVSVELNEHDKALLEAQDSQLLQGMRLEVAADLLVGSVRVKANDSIVEDFVQDRLKHVVKALHINETRWEEQSQLLHDDDETQETGER